LNAGDGAVDAGEDALAIDPREDEVEVENYGQEEQHQDIHRLMRW
jgi:hypothetical protein